ncbi:hypothetical protein BCP8-2_154 [Bacillus phage BCP8-2]|uniref:Uncharacterized protein n=1 Tax=Bacillus phage BCP8-2 TaxID=1129192 RepID=A0A0E3D9P6_9CAUD|nr:hypothetical protein BCP8-2_154 [Bacillus phage BCP8-2]AHJ87192.1 hypothetical protein BCP8-2_154 [Bacillus phage BCP8-2]
MLKFSGVSLNEVHERITEIEGDPAKEDISIDHFRGVTTVNVGDNSMLVEYGTLKVEII